MEELWGKLAGACREVCGQVAGGEIVAVTCTTFGADGAPVDAAGRLTYPVISWADSARTAEIARRVAVDPGGWPLFARTGYQIITFDTLLKLIWLRENAPEALERAETFLMTPGLLSFRLCGEKSLDPTSAGTGMMMDMAARDWAPELLALAGLAPEFFPRWVEPGEVIGAVTAEAAAETGLPVGLPVVACGHDTQFALFGAGARAEEAVLSSGTWEILLVRSPRYTATEAGFRAGLMIEADAVRGWWNPQLLMMGSGVLEWVRGNFFAEAEGEAAYERMIAAGRAVAPGSEGVVFLPSFVPDSGPTRKYNVPGAVLGLGLQTSPGQVYRAALEGLCFQMRWALEILRECVGFTAAGLRVVGGGSRNDLWNQLRADISGLPVTVIAQKEATVLGASRFALLGAGVFSTLEEAQAALRLDETVYQPGAGRAGYEELYARFRRFPEALGSVYGG
jgi:L-fuculokinase